MVLGLGNPPLLHLLALLLAAAAGVGAPGEEEGAGLGALPEAARRAIFERYPEARIVKAKAQRLAEPPGWEVVLKDLLNGEEPFVLRLGERGVLWKASRHLVSPRLVPEAVRAARLRWVELPREVEWRFERKNGESGMYEALLRLEIQGHSRSFRAVFKEDGEVVRCDDLPPGVGVAPRGPGVRSVPPLGPVQPAPAAGPSAAAPGGATAPGQDSSPRAGDSPALPAPPPPRVVAAGGERGGVKGDGEGGGEGATQEVDPDVVRKVKRLIRETLAEDGEERQKAWAELREMGNLAVPGLLAVYRLASTTPEMSGSILIALGDARDPRAGPALVEILGHKDPRVRRDAARALGHSKYSPAVEALKKVFERAEEDEEVRLFAAVGAARLGSKEGLPALRGLLGSRSAAIRSRAVFALGEHGGGAEVGRIAGMLKDEVEGVREDTVEALRKIGTREVWGPLVEATRDANYQVRSVAMGHLRRLTKEAFEDPAAWQEWWAKQPAGGQEAKGEKPPQGGGK